MAKKSNKLINIAVKALWIGFGVSFLTFVLFVYAVKGNWFNAFGEIPDFEILENPHSELASVLYTSDGVELGKYYSTNRTKVGFDAINKSVIKALIATEDERFEFHSGIDMRATLRVIVGVLTRNMKGGGSTISQQLAKNLFRMRDLEKYRSPNSLVMKAKEWIIASRLERSYTKHEIITMYLNTVKFGLKSTGINEAAKTYFNKAPIELNTKEAAVLVGTLKANTKYDPVKNPANSKIRRNVVMNQMVKYGYLEKAAYDSLKKQAIDLDFRVQDYNTGLATYFRAQIKSELEEICKKNGHNLYTDGLKIYTTIDSRLQIHAEAAVQEHLQQIQTKFLKQCGKRNPWKKNYIKRKIKRRGFYKELADRFKEHPDSIDIVLNEKRKTTVFTFGGERDTTLSYKEEFEYYQKFFHSGFLAVSPSNGQVKAWVGGLNQKHFAYDHVMQADRQVGSTFKPIVYASAVENGYSPCSEILDVPVSITMPDGKIWKPKVKPTNEPITLKECLAYSKNNCAAYLIDKIGPSNIADQAQKFGIPRRKLDLKISMALGTSSLSLLDMIPVYTTVVNNGDYIKPYYITKITDANGNVIYQNNPVPKNIMNPIHAYELVSMLRAGVMIGTGRSLNYRYNLLKEHNQLGGKTGTTQESKDGWFFCINKDLVAGCWVGFEDYGISFRSSRAWTGGSMALPIVAKFFQKTYKDKDLNIKPGPFNVPKELTEAHISRNITCEGDTSTSNTQLNLNLLPSDDDDGL